MKFYKLKEDKKKSVERFFETVNEYLSRRPADGNCDQDAHQLNQCRELTQISNNLEIARENFRSIIENYASDRKGKKLSYFIFTC